MKFKLHLIIFQRVEFFSHSRFLIQILLVYGKIRDCVVCVCSGSSFSFRTYRVQEGLAVEIMTVSYST